MQGVTEHFFEPSSNSFNNRYGRANEEQKKKYDVTLDKISKDFEANWPKMNDKEKDAVEISTIYARLFGNNFIS